MIRRQQQDRDSKPLSATAHEITVALTKTDICDLHDNREARMFVHHLVTGLFLLLMVAAVLTWNQGLWPVTLVIWALAGHVGHMKLMAIHEAAHGTLSKSRFRNELDGVLMGAIVLVPLSVYRYVHSQHHAYPGTPRDLELWPFVNPSAPRWLRITAATAELVLGYFYTPVLFLRGVLVGRNIPRAQRIRIAWEYALCVAIWCVLLAVATWLGRWDGLLIGYLPAVIIAGNLQSLRKFTEHMGLLGDSVLTTTRTVIDRRLLGALLSETMMHIDYHGTHHRYARLPYYHLPAATPFVYKSETNVVPIYSSYWRAMLDMARTLWNPRIGRQWIDLDDRRMASPTGPPSQRWAGTQRRAHHPILSSAASAHARTEPRV